MPRKGRKKERDKGRKQRRKQGAEKVVPGTPNTAEAPGGLRRFFRFSQLAMGEAGAGRKIEDIWATFLQELEDLAVPAEARSRLESLGAKKVFESAVVPGSVAKLAGGKENVAAIKETLQAARAATKGLSEGTLTSEWKTLLTKLAGDPRFDSADGRRILQELRGINPRTVAQVGANQTMSALVRRGDDPTILRLFNKVMRREGTARMPEGIQQVLKEAAGGKLPKVTAETMKVLTKEGVKGLGAGRKLLGMAGRSALGTAGLGLVAALEVGRAAKIMGRESRAKQLALQGFQGVGPASSAEFLREVVRGQEAVARRKVTLQQFHPELFQEVVRVLADTGQSPSTLTSTERRIGSDAQTGMTMRGRSDDDVQFLLNQLFSQMGQVGS